MTYALRPTLYALLILLLISCSGGDKKVQPLDEVVPAKIVRGTIEQKVMFTGNIVAQDAAKVFPRGSGRVSKKLLKEGDPVKKGQGILLVDRDDIGYTFKQMVVDSPMDGYVGSILVDVGSYVYARDLNSENPVAIVVHPGNVRVKLDIPERYLTVILPGTKVSMKVDTYGGENFEGEIITSSPIVDEKTRTAKIEVLIPNNEGKLRHGMFGRISLVVEKREDVLLAPTDSISWEADKRFVYKIEGDKVKRTEVTTGLRNDVHVEILGGLSENDAVAVGNLLDLKDGEKVLVK